MAVPKPFRLFIPRKTQKPVQQPDYGVDMRAIEAWAIALVNYVDSIAGGGSAYASLTGPGQTVTPGALTQAGPFTVDLSGSDSFDVNSASVDKIKYDGTVDEITLTTGTGLSSAIDAQAGNGGFVVLHPAGNYVQIGVSSTSLIQITSNTVTLPTTNTQILRFFGTGGSNQLTVTGSRGGNGALASLLTQLATYGLIIDSTTP